MCHKGACQGHFALRKTTKKILQSGLYRLNMFKDCFTYYKSCPQCQQQGKINTRYQMPLNHICVVEIFDYQGLDLWIHSFILLKISTPWQKWIMSPSGQNQWHARAMITKWCLNFFKENIFSRFGILRAIISDERSHFCNKPFSNLMQQYGVTHKVSTPHDPQKNSQAELTNREIKRILIKVVNIMRKDWSTKLSDALWAYKHNL